MTFISYSRGAVFFILSSILLLNCKPVFATEDSQIQQAYNNYATTCTPPNVVHYRVYEGGFSTKWFQVTCVPASCTWGEIGCNTGATIQLTGNDVPWNPSNPTGIDCPRESQGSIIRNDDQGLGEIIPIVGTPFNLVYTSERTAARETERLAQIPLLTSQVQQNIVSVTSTVLISGSTFSQTLTASPNLQTTFLWNGLGANGLHANSAVANITVSQNYSDNTVDIPLSYPVTLYSPLYNSFGVDGWSLSEHHFYDPNSGTLYQGDGSKRFVTTGTNSQGNLLAASSDGSQVFVFDTTGKHLQTLQGLTGAVLYTFKYDKNGNLASVKDSFGNVTSVLRDPSGNLSGIQGPYSQITNIGLNANGEIAIVTNPNSESYQMTYYAGNLLWTYQKPKSQLSTMVYDKFGNLLSDSSTAGNSTTLSLTFSSGVADLTSTSAQGYQSNSNYLGSTASGYYQRSDYYPDGSESDFLEQPNSSLIVRSNPYLSEQTNLVQDPRLGMMYFMPQTLSQSRTGPTNPLNSFYENSEAVYPPQPPNIFTYTSLINNYIINGNTFVSTYTPTNGLNQIVSPVGRKSSVTTNPQGQVKSLQQAKFLPTAFGYDSHGRLNSVSQGTRSSAVAYDPNTGWVQSLVNASGGTTSFIYDGAGRVKQTTLPDQRVIQYSYDLDGNLSQVIPPGSQASILNTSAQDELSLYSPPPLGSGTYSTTYQYNNDGQLTNILHPDQTQIMYSYDPVISQLKTITGSLINTSFGYFDDGRLASMQTEDAMLSLGYTGELATSGTTLLSNSGFQLSWSTVLNSNLLPSTTTVTANSNSSVSFKYDNDNLLTNAGAETLTPSPTTGLLSSTVLGKVKDAYGYDAKYADLISYSATGKSKLISLAYTRDAQGRIATKTEVVSSGTMQYTYKYDPAGRLTDVLIPSGTYSHFGYDSNSNRLLNIIGGRGTYSATYDAQDRIKTFGSLTYNFDLNGNLQTKTDTSTMPASVTQYSFDGFGNLKSVVLPNGTKIGYLADGFNRRVGRTVNGKLTNVWAYLDQTRLAASLDGTGKVLTQFVYASKRNVPDHMIVGSTTYRIISDAVGSPRFVVNSSSGAVTETITYDDLGMVASDSKPGFTPFGYAGGLYDQDTGLVLMGARTYDPFTGRWISKDPILFNGGDPNLYSYTFSDPINFIDPIGLFGFEVGGSLSAFIGSFLGFGGQVAGSYAGTVSNKTGKFESGKTCSAAGSPNGFGASAGATLYGSVTPFANSVSDLKGPFGGFQVETPIISLGLTFSSAGPTFSFGVGPTAGASFHSVFGFQNAYGQ